MLHKKPNSYLWRREEKWWASPHAQRLLLPGMRTTAARTRPRPTWCLARIPSLTAIVRYNCSQRRRIFCADVGGKTPTTTTTSMAPVTSADNVQGDTNNPQMMESGLQVGQHAYAYP